MTERRTAVTPLRSQSVAAMERTALPARAAEVSQLMNWSERTTLAVPSETEISITCVPAGTTRLRLTGTVARMSACRASSGSWSGSVQASTVVTGVRRPFLSG